MKDNLISKTFLWMCFGLLVTFATGYFVSTSDVMLNNIYNGPGYIIFVIVELVLVFVLSARVMKMKPTTAKVSFLLYSFVSGLTFSSIFVVYEITSVMFVFLITAIVFAIFAVIGVVTKIDLTKIGTYLMMALVAVLLCTLVNMFLNSPSFDLILSIAIVLIFIGFTAYDVQKIIRLDELNLIN